MTTAVDLFAGPGGWDVAARDLGLTVVGIENDPAACATRRAAGLRTVEGSVLDYAPRHFPAAGLIASPPCQTFSAAGKGDGRRALDDVLAAVKQLEADTDHEVPLHVDEKTALVVEPLRWALAARDDGAPYRWLALEQVPTVLPVWEACAEVLRRAGYSVTVGKLAAEQYGVPQTRTRAVLVARLDGEARLPAPTHSRYWSHAPERLDDGVPRWTTIRETLGWDDDEVVGIRSNYGTRGDPAARGERTVDEPAATVTGKVDRNRWILNAAGATGLAPRFADEPAATITGTRSAAWVAERQEKAQGAGLLAREGLTEQRFRPVDAPSYTITATSGGGSERLRFRGGTHARRVSVAEAAALQTFPADHPWQGNLGQRYQQVGNAVPPLLARAVLAEVIR